MKSIFSHHRSSAALSIFLGALCFPFAWNSDNWIPGGVSALASVLMWLPLLQYVQRDLSFGGGFRRAFGCLMLIYLFNLSWATVAMQDYGNMPLSASLAVVAAWAMVLAVFPALALGLFGVLRHRFATRPGAFGSAEIVLGAALLTLAQFVLSYIPLKGCPWLQPAYAWYAWIYPIQISAWVGALGLSFFIYLLALSLYALWLFKERRGAGLTLILFLGFTALGGWRLQHVETPIGHMRSGVVQANISQHEKWMPQGKAKAKRIYAEETRKLTADNAQLIVWPEAAIPEVFYAGIRQVRFETDYLGESLLLFGAPSQISRQGINQVYNTAFLLDPQGEVRDRYFKQILVPFGEFIPWSQYIPIDRLVPAVAGSFDSGTEATVMRVGRRASLGALICYESLFPRLSRKMVENGATFLVNITNDAWFNFTGGPYQHFNFLIFRAIESHRAILRSANTGFSGWIDPHGRVQHKTQLFTPDRFVVDLPLFDTQTFYYAFPHLIVIFCLFAVALYVGVYVYRHPGTFKP